MGRGTVSRPPQATQIEVVNWDGPLKKHHCTDIICLVLFLVFLVAWGFVAFMAFKDGDISKIIHPTDSKGRVCGNGDLKDRKYLMFFDLTRCLNPAVLAHGCLTPQVCVEKCPDASFSGYALAKSGQNAQSLKIMKPYCDPYVSRAPDWDRRDAMTLIKQGVCPAYVLPSTPVLGRCMPAVDKLSGNLQNNGPRTVTSSSFKATSKIITSNFKVKVSPVVEASSTMNDKDITYPTLQQAIYSLTAFLNVRDFFFRFSEDLVDTWWMIGLALVCSTVLSFIWIVMMRFLTGLMVWLSVALIFVLTGGLFVYCMYRYILIMNVVETQISIFEVNFTPDYIFTVLELRDTWLAFTIIIGIIFVVLILLLIALRRRINIAIQMIEEGSKAVGQMCSSLLFPVIPFIFHAIVAISAITIGMYLSSYGEQEYHVFYEHSGLEAGLISQETNSNGHVPECRTGDCINPMTKSVYEYNDACDPSVFNETCKSSCTVDGMQTPLLCTFNKYQKVVGIRGWMQWFNLFGFYWAMNFVTSFGEMVLAGVFVKWYWTKDKSQLPCCIPLFSSIFNATIYHLGTIAFGSLIIAIIKIIRAVVGFVESKIKKTTSNDLSRCLLCACRCCLWCLEKFMMFINRNAYIVCAVRSTNFLSSGKEAFTLIISNAVRTFVLNKMVDFLLFLGKMVIVVGAGTVSYFVFYGYFPELFGDTGYKIPELNYSFTPIICIVIGTYFVTTSFFNVYAMAVDTLFLCFLQDLKQNDGTPQRPYFMSKGLRKAVGAMQKFREENINQRLEHLSKEKERLNQFEIQPMLNH